MLCITPSNVIVKLQNNNWSFINFMPVPESAPPLRLVTPDATQGEYVGDSTSRPVIAVGHPGEEMVEIFAVELDQSQSGYLGLSVDALRRALPLLERGTFLYVRSEEPEDPDSGLFADERVQEPKDPDIALFADGRIEMDYDRFEVRVDGSAIKLTNMQYSLLKYLILNKGIVCSRARMYEEIWGDSISRETDRCVDVHIRRVRQALGEELEWVIHTKRSVGYMFDDVVRDDE